ncbi:MAG TPA: DUF1697 domain-containing protein [Candidatus Bathyarchaeia archaeon]|nr:DUF1697 domain-containing protein [Candidatus Bathyarchaeia archaeon]
MTKYVALLRGVNVGGHTRLKMPDLVQVCESLGFHNAKTYLQSGNVVFDNDSRDGSSVAMQIEKRLKDHLGLQVSVFIRTPNDLARIVAGQPFKNRDRTRLHVTFLKSTPKKNREAEIRAVARGGEEFSISNLEVYLFLPNGMGKTKLSNNFIEKTLGVPATTRNWTTTNALLEMTRTN